MSARFIQIAHHVTEELRCCGPHRDDVGKLVLRQIVEIRGVDWPSEFLISASSASGRVFVQQHVSLMYSFALLTYSDQAIPHSHPQDRPLGW